MGSEIAAADRIGGWATIEVATRHLGKRSFHYRAGTSDEPVIQQIFIQRDYDISHLSRAGDICAVYNRALTGRLRAADHRRRGQYRRKHTQFR